jgi:RNA polymerase sigma factor (sigma-70 family)
MTFLFYHLRGNLIRTVSAAVSQSAVPLLGGDLASLAGSEVVDHGSADGAEIGDSLGGQERVQPDEMLMMKELINLSRSATNALDPLEREVIERIYLKEQPLLDIADALGYSRCHISRVKRKALESLAAHLNKVLEIPVEADECEASQSKKVTRRRASGGDKAILRAQFLMNAHVA